MSIDRKFPAARHSLIHASLWRRLLLCVAVFGALFPNRLESLGSRRRIPLRGRSRSACTCWPGRPRRVSLPDWYRGVADRIGPAVAESNRRMGARPDGRE